jgi:hypothetical protein
MSEQRETANPDMIRRSRVWRGISPPVGRKILNLVHKKIHKVNFFVNKIKQYHAAAGDSAVHRMKRPV